MAVVGPASLSSPARSAVHGVVVAFGWALFVFGWFRVAESPWDARELRLLIVASALVLPSLTVLWILHNVALYRGRRRRRSAPRVDQRYETDWVGRTIEADWAALDGAREVRIDVGAGVKRFVAEVPGLEPPQADAPEHRAASHTDPATYDITSLPHATGTPVPIDALPSAK